MVVGIFVWRLGGNRRFILPILLDGFDPRSGIVLLAATNRPEVVDPTLLRAGRFDRQVVVDRPERISRIAILKVHLKKITTAPEADPEKIAGITPGFTGADLANLVNEAAIVATRRSADAVAMQDFTSAVERIVAGSEIRSRLMNADERQRVAWHEMGHALVAASLPGMDPVHKVSIIPRSIGALGYTLQRPIEDRFLITKEVDLAMRELVREAYDEATRILQKRKQDLDRGAALLLEKETLTPAEFPAMQPSEPLEQPRMNKSKTAEEIH